MRKRDNFAEINEMRKMLSEVKSLTLENFIMPEEDSFEKEMPQEDDVLLQQKMDNDVTGIEKELIEIRKIALSVINRLADQTSSESYDTMKRIWSLVDKAIESKNDESKRGNNMNNF